MGVRPTLKPLGHIDAAIAKIEQEIEQGIESKVEFYSIPSRERIYLHEPPFTFPVNHTYGDTNNVRLVHEDTPEALKGCPVCSA